MQIIPFKINNPAGIESNKKPCKSICFKQNGNWLEHMQMALDFRQYCDIGQPLTRFHCIPGYEEALSNFDNIQSFIRLGGESVVFGLGDNVLKMSPEKYTPYLPEYHAPEVERGEIKLSQKYRASNNTYLGEWFDTDKIYYVIQQKGELISHENESKPLCDKARNAGLCIVDSYVDQFAYFDTPEGRVLRCVDLGCITDKSYFMLREFEAMEKMTPEISCRSVGILHLALSKYFTDIFKSGPQIKHFVDYTAKALENGKNLFDIMNNLLAKCNKPILEHIKWLG